MSINQSSVENCCNAYTCEVTNCHEYAVRRFKDFHKIPVGNNIVRCVCEEHIKLLGEPIQ